METFHRTKTITDVSLFLGKLGSSFKCFGAAPLENIVKNRKHLIMEDLENALAQQAPTIQHPNPDLHELPPLVSRKSF